MLTRQLNNNRIDHTLPPRIQHRRTFPLKYQDKEISDSKAVSMLGCLLEPHGRETVLYVNYAMSEMNKMILLEDQDQAVALERDCPGEELVLSCNVGLGKDDPLPEHTRKQTHNLLLLNLKDTTAEDLTKAINAGFLGFTLKSLEVLRDRIMQLGDKDMELLIYLTWKKSAPQLARRLALIQDGQRG